MAILDRVAGDDSSRYVVSEIRQVASPCRARVDSQVFCDIVDSVSLAQAPYLAQRYRTGIRLHRRLAFLLCTACTARYGKSYAIRAFLLRRRDTPARFEPADKRVHTSKCPKSQRGKFDTKDPMGDVTSEHRIVVVVVRDYIRGIGEAKGWGSSEKTADVARGGYRLWLLAVVLATAVLKFVRRHGRSRSEEVGTGTEFDVLIEDQQD